MASQRTVSTEPAPPTAKHRFFLPFWVQLFGSYLLILAVVAVMGAYTWPHVERRVFNVNRTYAAMSAAETAAFYFDPTILAHIGPDVEARTQDHSMQSLRRLYGAPAFTQSKRPNPRPSPTAETQARGALASPLQSSQGENLDALAQNGDFTEFVLEFSLVVPTAHGWVRWLSSDSALVGKPFPWGNYLDSYLETRGGFDNALNERGQFTVISETDASTIARIDEERRIAKDPPMLGLNIATDPILSVRPLHKVVDVESLPERARLAGADFSRSAIVAEYPRERLLARTYLLKLIFFGILVMSTLLAMVVAIFMTFRINRPVRQLYEAMSEVADGSTGVRVEGMERHDEFGRLAGQFNSMMNEIENSRELTAGVAVAAQIQRSLLPDAPGNIPAFDLAAWYHPSSQVSGDYYDFIEKEGRLFLVIGDAVGHGVDSGLIMATARAMVRTIIENEDEPARILTVLNRLLSKDFRDGNFLTCAVACVDIRTREMHLASAGHEPVVHVSGAIRSARMIRANNPPLGVFELFEYKSAAPVHLGPADVVVLSSDGIRECHDPDRRLFGMERFLAVVAKPVSDAAGVVESVQEALRVHARGRSLDDDVSLVVLRTRPESESSGECRRPRDVFSGALRV